MTTLNLQDGRNHSIPCVSPEHSGDRDSDSLSVIWENSRNKWGRLKCFTHECSYASIAQALDEQLGIEYKTPIGSTIVAHYPTRDGTSRIQQHRMDYPRDFPDGPCSFGRKRVCGKTNPHKHMWISPRETNKEDTAIKLWSDKPGNTLIAVEGEKCARVLEGRDDLTPVTWIGGALSADLPDWSAALGRDVVVWPDNDPDGQKCAQLIHDAALEAGALSVKEVDYSFLNKPDKWDAADATPEERDKLLANNIRPFKPRTTSHAQLPLQRQAKPTIPSASGLAFPLACYENTTDAANAERLLSLFSDKLMVVYDELLDNPAEVFIVTDTGVWSKGAALLHTLFEVSKKYHETLVDISDAKEHGQVARHARRLKDKDAIDGIAAVIAGVVYQLLKEQRLPANLTIARPDELNSNLRFMGFPNGVLDLHELKLLPANTAREGKVTVTCPDPWNPEATHPLINKLMPKEPLSTEMGWWYDALAWTTMNRPKREFIGQITPPGAGKTAWRNADANSFGHAHISEVRPEALMYNRRAGGGESHNGDILQFSQPRRRVYVPEAKQVDNRLLNQLSGGESNLRARDVGEKAVRIRVTAHLIIQANEQASGKRLLGIGDDDTDPSATAATKERAKLIPMKRIEKEDQDDSIIDAGSGESEDAAQFRQAFVARVLSRCPDIVAEGNKFPEAVGSMTEELERMEALESPLWMEEWLKRAFAEITEGEGTNSHEAYTDYQEWHEGNAEGKPEPKRKITDAIQRQYETSTKQTKITTLEGKRLNAVVFEGLRLKSEDERGTTKKSDDDFMTSMEKEIDEPDQRGLL